MALYAADACLPAAVTLFAGSTLLLLLQTPPAQHHSRRTAPASSCCCCSSPSPSSSSSAQGFCSATSSSPNSSKLQRRLGSGITTLGEQAARSAAAAAAAGGGSGRQGRRGPLTPGHAFECHIQCAGMSNKGRAGGHASTGLPPPAGSPPALTFRRTCHRLRLPWLQRWRGTACNYAKGAGRSSCVCERGEAACWRSAARANNCTPLPDADGRPARAGGQGSSHMHVLAGRRLAKARRSPRKRIGPPAHRRSSC